ncbi:A-kinase-interacting protein 1 isoform 1-T2 [Synchiropus picturatus]
MAAESRLESSLRRSASLGLQVLQRASRRNVDWNNIHASHSATFTDVQTGYERAKTHTQLNEAFASMADFMAHTTHQCMRFYQSNCCTDRSHMEKEHVQRFHPGPAPGPSTAAMTTKRRERVSSAGEDFSIEVAAGTYSVTASVDESQQQTQVVTLTPGESVHLTFSL